MKKKILIILFFALLFVIFIPSISAQIHYGPSSTYGGSGSHWWLYPSVSALDDNHFIVAYDDSGYARIGTVCCNDAISISGAYQYGPSGFFGEPADVSHTYAVALDSTHFVVAYHDRACAFLQYQSGQVRLGAISGNSISYPSMRTFNPVVYPEWGGLGQPPLYYGTTMYISVAKLSSTSFVIAYNDAGYAGTGTVVVGSRSGNTISVGGENRFSHYGCSLYSTAVTGLDSTHFILAFRSVLAGQSHVAARVCTVSGRSVSFGALYTALGSGATDPSLSTIDSTHFTISCGVVKNATVSGNVISYESEYTPTYPLPSRYISYFDANHFVSITSETAKIGTIGNVTPTQSAQKIWDSGTSTEKTLDATNVERFPTSFNTTIEDADGDYMNVTVMHNNNGHWNIVDQTSSGMLDGTYHAYNTSWVDTYSTTYHISFNVSDSNENWCNTSHSFTTRDDKLPVQSDISPIIGEDSADLTPSLSVTCNDADGDDILTATWWSCNNIGGYTVLPNSEYVFSLTVDVNTNPSSCALDAQHFVVVHNGKARIGVTDVNAISYGSEYTYGDESPFHSFYSSVDKLDSTHFIVAYNNKAKIGTVSGSTISFGSEYTFNADSTYYTDVSVLDSTHFVVAFQDYSNSEYGTTVIGTVSGSKISFGFKYVFNSGSTNEIAVSSLDSTHFVVIHGTSEGGKAKIGTVSGSTISYLYEYTFNSGVYDTTADISVDALDSTHFMVAYEGSAYFHYNYVIVGTVSLGTVISFGSAFLFAEGSTDSTSIRTIMNGFFILTYTHSHQGKVIIGSVSDTSISFGTASTFNSGWTYKTDVSVLGVNRYVVTYKDWSNSYYGTACLLTGTGGEEPYTQFATNTSISPGDTITQVNPDFSSPVHSYIWRLCLTDGFEWTNETYYFTTGGGHPAMPIGISGYAYNTNRDIIPNATVIITNDNSGDIDTGVTDSTGLYTCSLSASSDDLILANASSGNLSGVNNTFADTDVLTQWLNVTLSYGTLRAAFTYSPRFPQPDQTVVFRDLSGGPPDTWYWNFGDGTTAVGKNQNHIYRDEGSYLVSLEVRSGAESDRVQKTVQVRDTSGPAIPPVQPPVYPLGYTIEECYRMIHGDKLGKSNSQITVVVMDSGLQPQIYNNTNLNNIIIQYHPSYESGYDFFGHGTFVSYQVAYLLQLKAPNAKQISYRAFDKDGMSSETVFLESLDEIKELNPDVVSISAGAFGNPTDVYSNKVKELHNMGIIVVSCAAGNLGPASSTILSPACSMYAIAVGASNPEGTVGNLDDDTICPWSSRGPVTGLSEAKPDVVAPGESIVGPWGNVERITSGTSLSTPLIAGGTAVIVAENKQLIDITKTLWFWNRGVVPDAYENALERGCIQRGDENAWGAGFVQLDSVSNHFYWNLIILLLIPIIVICLIISAIIIYWKRDKIREYLL